MRDYRLGLSPPCFVLLALSLGLSATAVAPRSAHACGGCVAPSNTFSAVTQHRMAIRLGLEESVLWDQFVYEGAPEEFAWLLPVPSGDALVEVADENFMDTLDRETSPIVLSPSCEASASGGCGFGPIPTPEELSSEVKVHRHEMVGPYETVVIEGDTGIEIAAWLETNDFAFPPFAQNLFDEYAAGGASFVVVRLRPGQDVSAMQPLRIRFRGYLGTFPLKMIALGAAGAIDLSLWVIGDQRYEAANYPNARVQGADIPWDWETESADYDAAFEDTIVRNGGNAWITEYSQVLAGSALEVKLEEEARKDLAHMVHGLQTPVVTRLRTRMHSEFLSEDLSLMPAEDPSAVPREIRAGGDCPALDESPEGPSTAGLGWFLPLVLAGLAALRARSRR